MPQLHPLQKIDVNDYDMSLSEKLAGGALKQYFLLEQEESKKALGDVLKRQIFILNPRSPEKPLLVAADINAPALADLIDTAAKYTTALSVQNSMKAEDPTLHLTAAVVAAKIDGKATVGNLSAEFLRFLTDCCAAMFQ